MLTVLSGNDDFAPAEESCSSYLNTDADWGPEPLFFMQFWCIPGPACLSIATTAEAADGCCLSIGQHELRQDHMHRVHALVEMPRAWKAKSLRVL